jgi:hypothetical protein
MPLDAVAADGMPDRLEQLFLALVTGLGSTLFSVWGLFCEPVENAFRGLYPLGQHSQKPRSLGVASHRMLRL